MKKIFLSEPSFTGSEKKYLINEKELKVFFLKKYNYRINLDLQILPQIDDLELTFNIINPNRVSVLDQNNPNVEVYKNSIKWKLIPGEKNSIEFSIWSWNKLLLGFLLIVLIILIAYFLRSYKYKIGSNFPELPSS